MSHFLYLRNLVTRGRETNQRYDIYLHRYFCDLFSLDTKEYAADSSGLNP